MLFAETDWRFGLLKDLANRLGYKTWSSRDLSLDLESLIYTILVLTLQVLNPNPGHATWSCSNRELRQTQIKT